jgi:AI-2 transport protein TqsA
VVIIIVLIMIFFIVLIFALYESILSLVQDSDKYATRFGELYQMILDWAESRGISEETVLSWLPDISISALAVQFVAIMYELIPAAVLCLLFTIYMLLDYNEKSVKTRLQREIDGRIRKYILIKIFMSLLIASLNGAVYFIFSVELWFLFALLTFLLNFIPNIGSVVAVALPLPIVLFDPAQQWWSILVVFVVPSLFQFITGNVLEPSILGTSMDISAVSVLVCLAYWGYIWGIVGAFISVCLRCHSQVVFALLFLAHVGNAACRCPSRS